MQLGWITGGNQIGEVVAKRLGYFAEENIDFAIQAGGPNIDGVAIVASGPLRGRPGLVEPVADAGGLAEPAGDLLRGRRAAAPLCVLLAAARADQDAART